MFRPEPSGYGCDVSNNVKVVTKDGKRDYVGSTICDGPGVYRLMLTWPFKVEGQIVEVPLEDIAEVVNVEVGELGEPPRVEDTRIRA